MTQKDEFHSDAETAKMESQAKALEDVVQNMPVQTDSPGLSEKQDETLNKLLQQAKDIQRIREINQQKASQDPTEAPEQVMGQQTAQSLVDQQNFERQLARLEYKSQHSSSNYDSTILNHDDGLAKPITTDDMYAAKLKNLKKKITRMQK